MADVSLSENIPVSAESAWEVIGDFGGIQKWASVIQESKVEDTPAGKVRTLTTADGSVIQEVLVTSSQFSYSYGFTDRPSLPDYRSTVAVVPLDLSSSAIFLSVHVSPTEELSEEALTERYEKFVIGNMKAMKRAIGVPKS
jgi:hypothetical protein